MGMRLCGIAAVLVCGFWFVTACQAANFGEECEGQTMKSGDSCVEWVGGEKGDVTTYEEGQREAAEGTEDMKTAGTILVVGAGLVFVSGKLDDHLS
ncbi:hypothetical protein [Streptomyces candidus]|uniref:Lipoprotein n=1 Tax=Streptomyces candidus TaxID=67283 RepID=A0A7X0LS72_9ACTN|nr:hypothetical protein [Streptomyces candidus]MBB6438882.1 hypothetical protein [Streptomyces candidus]